MQFFPLRFVHLQKAQKKSCGPAKVDVWKGPDQSFVPTHGQKLPDKLLCAECAFVEAPKSRQLYVTYTTRGRKERDRQTDRATAYARAPHTLDGSFECLYLCTLLSHSPAAACLPLATRHLPHATCHLPLALFAWLGIILTTFGRKRHTNFIGKLLVRVSATAITSQTNVQWWVY